MDGWGGLAEEGAGLGFFSSSAYRQLYDDLAGVVQDLRGDLIHRVLEIVLDDRVAQPPHGGVRLEEGQEA